MRCIPIGTQLNDGAQAGTGNNREWQAGDTLGVCLALGLGPWCPSIVGASSGKDNGTNGGTQSNGNDSLNTLANLADALLNAAKDGTDAAINTSRELGMDPATGTFRQSEYDTALRIEQERGVVPRDRRVGVMWPSAAASTEVPDLTAR